jgi:soluble lytic murein transglycosylase-like protein
VPPQVKRAVVVAAVLFIPIAELQTPTTSAGPKPVPAAKPAATGLRCPVPSQFRGAFSAAAIETGVPLPLLVSVAHVESEMNPNAVSPMGAQGLLQLMPATAQELRLDPTRPHTNVLGGARYLRTMLDRFGSAELALAAYNAGPTAVARAGGAPSAETAAYVAEVTTRWRSLAGCT